MTRYGWLTMLDNKTLSCLADQLAISSANTRQFQTNLQALRPSICGNYNISVVLVSDVIHWQWSMKEICFIFIWMAGIFWLDLFHSNRSRCQSMMLSLSCLHRLLDCSSLMKTASFKDWGTQQWMVQLGVTIHCFLMRYCSKLFSLPKPCRFFTAVQDEMTFFCSSFDWF